MAEETIIQERVPIIMSGKAPDLGDKRLNDMAVSVIQMQAEMAAMNEAERNSLRHAVMDLVAEALAERVDSLKNIGDDGGGGGAAAKSGRYRNDTLRSLSSDPRYQPATPDDGGGKHQIEDIGKSSPWDPVATAANGVDTYWNDSEWTLVPGAVAV